MDSQNNCIYRFYLWVDCYKLWEFEEKKTARKTKRPFSLNYNSLHWESAFQNLYTKDKHISVKKVFTVMLLTENKIKQ